MHNVLRLMLAKKKAQKTQEQRENKDGEKVIKDLQESIKNAIIRL